MQIELVAQVIEQIGSRFRGTGARAGMSPWLVGLLLVLVVAAAVFLRWRYRKLRAREGAYDPVGLFYELSRIHGLTRSQSRLLLRIGRAINTTHPAAVFLQPEAFWQVTELPTFQKRKAEWTVLADRIYERIPGDEKPDAVHGA